MAEHTSGRSFAIGTLTGIAPTIYGLHQAVNAISGKPLQAPDDAVIGSVAIIVAGSLGVLVARFFPAWFTAIEGGQIVVDEPAPPPPSEDTTMKTFSSVGRGAAVALLLCVGALSGCSIFSPSSEIRTDATSFEGHAPPGSNAIAIDGQPNSCMPKRLIALGAQDLKAVSASLTCTHPDGSTETATLGVGEVGASQSQQIVAGTTNKALDTVDKAMALAAQGVAAANPATIPLAQRPAPAPPQQLSLPPSSAGVTVDPSGLK